MYSAPPEGETRSITNDESEKTESEAEERTPELEPTAATTDANWTGNVPADD
jgi:hypothetical protein